MKDFYDLPACFHKQFFITLLGQSKNIYLIGVEWQDNRGRNYWTNKFGYDSANKVDIESELS